MEKRGTRFTDEALNLVEAVEPTRRTDDERYPGAGDRPYVGERGLRIGKLDDAVRARGLDRLDHRPRVRGHARRVLGLYVHRARDLVSALPRGLGDHVPHLSVTDEGDLHPQSPPSAGRPPEPSFPKYAS